MVTNQTVSAQATNRWPKSLRSLDNEIALELTTRWIQIFLSGKKMTDNFAVCSCRQENVKLFDLSYEANARRYPTVNNES